MTCSVYTGSRAARKRGLVNVESQAQHVPLIIGSAKAPSPNGRNKTSVEPILEDQADVEAGTDVEAHSDREKTHEHVGD